MVGGVSGHGCSEVDALDADGPVSAKELPGVFPALLGAQPARAVVALPMPRSAAPERNVRRESLLVSLVFMIFKSPFLGGDKRRPCWIFLTTKVAISLRWRMVDQKVGQAWPDGVRRAIAR